MFAGPKQRARADQVSPMTDLPDWKDVLEGPGGSPKAVAVVVMSEKGGDHSFLLESETWLGLGGSCFPYPWPALLPFR